MKQNSISEIILASGSPRRRELLEQIGIVPRVCPSGADEASAETRPERLVEDLSRRKCLDIAGQTRTGVVLGADTVVAVDGVILGKPKSEAEAAEMLRRISGRTHQVYTGVTLARTENGNVLQEVTFSEKTDVHVAEMTEEEIAAYVATGDCMDKAGAYGIQGVFSKHVTGISGDYFNVVGLPVAAVYEHLKELQI